MRTELHSEPTDVIAQLRQYQMQIDHELCWNELRRTHVKVGLRALEVGSFNAGVRLKSILECEM